MILAGSGGALNTVFDNPTSSYSTLGDPSITDAGAVAFRTLSDSTRGDAIHVGSAGGGPVTTVVDTSGPFGDLGEPSINNAGEIAFYGFPDGGPIGIYNGHDPQLDKVIELREPLLSSTLSGVGRFPVINDRGDIAFHYTLADGRTGIALAVLVPEPSAVAILAVAAA